MPGNELGADISGVEAGADPAMAVVEPESGAGTAGSGSAQRSETTW